MMGVFDRKDDPKKASDKGKAPDFSNVRSGGSSTAPSPPGQAPATRTYVVEKGDSLSKIAKREYGDANKWRQIYEANRDIIKDPDLIYPGQTLKLPPSA
jgi:nucleoid-associated protein YgaU